MPTVKDVAPVIARICDEIRAIPGVHGIYLHGSYPEHLHQPQYVVKDVDIIAATNFDSGDLLAIDNTKYSALRVSPKDLEDEGFNPKAVSFTKKFLSFAQYNVDHWATSSDGKVLHWGAIPDTQDDWAALHSQAEKRAEKDTGLSRQQLTKVSDAKRKEWKQSYDQYISMFLSSKSVGWYPSEHTVDEILNKAKKVS